MSLIDELSHQLVEQITHQKLMLTTAESCTGGGISQAVTDVSGSSQCFSHGFITYSNLAKQQLLSVDAALIEQHGAVSQSVVEAMALGALDKANADVAVAVSGIAGPGGGTVEKPVGTVWISWVRRGITTDSVPISQRFQFSGNRKSVRNQSVEESLKGLIKITVKNTV